MGLGHFLLEIGKCPPNSHNPAIDVMYYKSWKFVSHLFLSVELTVLLDLNHHLTY